MTIAPQTYKINQSVPLSIFPVPFDNAIGTNDLNNAITIFSFPEGKLRDDRYFRNTVKDMEGSGKYLPVISKDKIGFSLGRLFLLFNFKTQTAKVYRLAFSIGRTVEKMAIADADRKRFIVEVESMSNKSEDWRDSKNYLQLIELGDKEVKLLKEVSSDAATWSIGYGRVFLWQFSKKILQVYDMSLEPSTHPLGDLIKQKKDKLNFGLIYAHPQLPFAILSDTVISWGEGRNKNPQLLVTGSEQFSFSPDGKWVSFLREDYENGRKLTYRMPVSEKYPNYLGTPILLVDRYFEPENSNWTTNPVSFVASGAKDLYRWELTNEAQKVSGYPTFHDYIVAKDSEKLTKEKKQGLGKK